MPLPQVTGITPDHGRLGGDTTVTITGVDFTGASAVDFGATPASSFTVNSDTSITATSPAGSGAVNVTVTTPVGTSATASAGTYTYDAADPVAAISAAPASTVVSHATAALGSYTLITTTITNNGPTLPATSVTVLLNAYGIGNVVNSTASLGLCMDLTCFLGTIAPHASATVKLLMEPEGEGSLNATVTASSPAPDPNRANNTASVTTPVTNANGCTTIGTHGSDVLTGDKYGAVLCGLAGNDSYFPQGDNNNLNIVTSYIGSGTDEINLGQFGRLAYGGTVYGGYGWDEINNYGVTDVTIFAGDFLYPGAHYDSIYGGGVALSARCYVTHADIILSPCAHMIIK